MDPPRCGRKNAVVADLTGGDPSEGIRTENGVMSLPATEYVKEEITSMTLMGELGEESYWTLCKIPRP
jgi:hypothetical protein